MRKVRSQDLATGLQIHQLNAGCRPISLGRTEEENRIPICHGGTCGSVRIADIEELVRSVSIHCGWQIDV